MARKSEGFRFLESGLRRNILTVPKSGGLEWWPEMQVPGTAKITSLQFLELASLTTSSNSASGLPLQGTPEHATQLSWLAPTPPSHQNSVQTSTATPKWPNPA
jgi:hypothetical protein